LEPLRTKAKNDFEFFTIAFQNGEEQGFDYFFRKLYPSLCFFANRIVHDKCEAEEIASNAFIKIWNKQAQFSNVNNIRAYLYQIVRNDCLKSIQKKARVAQMHEDVKHLTMMEKADNFETEIIRAEFYGQLYEAINSLPGQCKEIMNMLYSEGKTVKEISEELNLSKSTVKTQKARGIIALKKKTGLLSILLIGLNLLFGI